MRKRCSEIDAALELVRTSLREWDPIGVFPNWPDSPARDEYDSYAPHIVTMLSSAATWEEIARELTRIRTEPIGLPANSDRDVKVAKHLVSEWQIKNPLGSGRANSRLQRTSNRSLVNYLAR